ncbi:RND efflux system, outer membrane lipoprotein Cm eC [Formosa agariphila KMM 3901]|uniref:RND efflux system, outer membrane lipoprotein Cm eC n=1 Tax=Formosa agariphila (strain DSM 15362 / KCTC 12365 / LMG 23005 / KMM 3901 / M-2Alg 35-1) TaxID=1347342 RepID=T2KK32_FORAG|nr:TolC family protein [Formosa agariphila]CDF79252.1 RND efflux system, outer membrane lipoprotein Cm eC [Formosa agariphila KMM 3901]
MKIISHIFCFFFVIVASAQTSDSIAKPKVWSLEDCITYAVENNITVKDAGLGKDISEVNYSRAKSARLPDLFGSATQNFSNGNTIDPITSDYVTDQIYSSNVGVSSAMTLYQGSQLKNQIAQNKLLVDQNEFLIEEAKNNIIVSILENYLQILYTKEDIIIAQNNLEASEKEVIRSKARLDAGTIALNDYTEAQSQAATNKYSVITAKNNYQQYIITLKQLLELGPLDTIEVEAIADDIDLINLEMDKMNIYYKALNVLPEMSASDLDIAINEKELDIAKGGYMPTLSLIGSVGSGYTSISDINFSDQLNVNFNQKIGVNLTIPIFNRNETKNAVKTAKINIERAQIQKQSTEKEIFKKVETAYQNALSAQEQLIAAEASQEAALQSYNLAKTKYELGDLSTTDLIINQNTYTTAQQNYIQAKYLNILYHQLLQFYQGNDIKL